MPMMGGGGFRSAALAWPHSVGPPPPLPAMPPLPPGTAARMRVRVLMAFTTDVSAATTASVWMVSLFLAALGAIRLS